MTRTRQNGFTLVELMIALLVTLVISGAVFALMTAGQGSFRREPALTDRQQNIRVAMDMIQRDVGTGGAGMPKFQQVFSPYELGTNITLNARGAAYGQLGVKANQPVDFLEVFGNDGQCPDIPVSSNDGNNLNMGLTPPDCYGEDQFVMVIWPPPIDRSGWGFAHEIHGGQEPRKINFPPGLPPIPTADIPGQPPWPCADPPTVARPCAPARMQRIQLVRYEIANEADGVPGLWRSVTGGFSSDNDYCPASVPQNRVPGTACYGFWQLAARGVEDLQVRYRTAAAAGYIDVPPVLGPDLYENIVRDVEVTLWARAIGPNLQGETDAANQPRAVRGSLVSVTTPRAALVALRSAGTTQGQWR